MASAGSSTRPHTAGYTVLVVQHKRSEGMTLVGAYGSHARHRTHVLCSGDHVRELLHAWPHELQGLDWPGDNVVAAGRLTRADGNERTLTALGKQQRLHLDSPEKP